MNFFSEHKFIFITAFLMAILVASPALLFPLMSGQAYEGINIGNWGADDSDYLARGRDILEGHGQGNPYLKDGKDVSEIHHSYVEYVILLPIKLFGLADKANIVNVYNTYNFFAVAVLILSIYFFILYISENKLLASLIALFVVGGYNFVFWYQPFFSPFSQNLNVYARPLIPVFSSIVLFIHLNLLARTLKKNDWNYAFYSALTFGALFYVYFYAWTFALALLGVLFLIYLLKRDFGLAKKIFFIASAGVLLGAYNLWQIYLFSRSDFGQRSLFFSLAGFSRAPIFNKLSFLALLLFTVFIYKNRKDGNWPLILSTIAAFWAVLNQQIITGRVIQLHHYIWYFIAPMSVVVGFYMLWSLFGESRYVKYRNALCVLLLILPFLNTGIRQYQGTLDTFDVKQYAQNYGPLIDILNKDKNQSVVLTSDWFYSNLIPVYTSHDLFWTDGMTIFNVPLERIEEALYVYLYLNKESRKDFVGYLNKIMAERTEREWRYMNIYQFLESWGSGLRYDDYAHMAFVKKEPEMLPKRHELLASLDEKYEKLAEKNGTGVINLLKSDGVKYIIWDKNKNPEWDLLFLSNLQELVESNNVILYRLN